MTRHQTDRRTGELVLDAGAVREVARAVGRAATRLAEARLADARLPAATLGASAAGGDLARAYDDVHGRSVTADEACADDLGRFAEGLRGAASDLEETDELDAVALDRIARHGPGSRGPAAHHGEG